MKSNHELVEQPFTTILEQLADSNPTPGGGAAAAAAAAMAAAILQMVAATTRKRNKYAAGWPAADAALGQLPELQDELSRAISEDAVVYREVMLLLAHQNEANSRTAIQAIEDALTAAAQVPLKVARLGTELVVLGRGLAETGNIHAAADAAAACFFAAAAVRSSAVNVVVNLQDVSDLKLKRSWTNQVNRLVGQVNELTSDLDQLVKERLSSGKSKPPGRRTRRVKS